MILTLGIALVVLGLVIMAAQKLGFGRLPGDFVFRRKGFTLVLPIASSIVLSVVATLLLNMFRK